MRTAKRENYWVSLSDLMTGLMVIFMFIAIAYIQEVKSEQKEREAIIKEYRDTRVNLYLALKKEFEEDFRAEKWHAQLDEDLSIRFMNEEVLFEFDRANLQTDFKQILGEFFPRYLSILLNDKFKDQIAEVRIEGHTDSQGSYMYNVELSQLRTANVLKFLLFRSNSMYNNMNNEEKVLIRYWFTANGFSYGRTIDTNGDYTIESGKREDRVKSRRVEFRIITKSEQVVKEIIKSLEESGDI